MFSPVTEQIVRCSWCDPIRWRYPPPRHPDGDGAVIPNVTVYILVTITDDVGCSATLNAMLRHSPLAIDKDAAMQEGALLMAILKTIMWTDSETCFGNSRLFCCAYLRKLRQPHENMPWRFRELYLRQNHELMFAVIPGSVFPGTPRVGDPWL